MVNTRFIDLAAHGGCSKKATSGELRRLLGKVAVSDNAHGFTSVADGFPDVGIYELKDTKSVSTIDVVLPMTLRADDFGRITALHVLSDLYAGLADPAFALAILGVPRGMDADDEQIVSMLTAARNEFASAGATLVGGHTLAHQEDLFLGFAAVGTPMQGAGMSLNRSVLPEDVLVLTKPVGASLAMIRWKIATAQDDEHADVLRSMLTSNRSAAIIAVRHQVRGCTDVTGYGLLGHIHNLCYGSDIACSINIKSIPIFDSVLQLGPDDIHQTRQYFGNLESLQNFVYGIEIESELIKSCIYDSQVSGGLVLAVKKNRVDSLLNDMRNAGIPAAVIGVARKGPAGRIEILE